jgi:hypothetical protein
VKAKTLYLLFLLSTLFFSCEKEGNDPAPYTNSSKSVLDEIENRNFKMGFTSWPYAATLGAQDSTYAFLQAEGDIYAEHIDDKIPWSAWINNTALPTAFTNNILGRKNRKIAENQLLVSVSLLNNLRTDLAEDFNGLPPTYDSLNQSSIEDAYVQHINYIVGELQPNYLLLAIEANELLINSPNLWESYKKLITNVRSRIKTAHPTVQLSESVTLHNWYNPNALNSSLVREIQAYVNQNQDFVAISYYPFFQQLENVDEYQKAFDFLHSQTNKRIAFAETTQIAEDLIVSGLNLNILSSQGIQKDYLETLLLNAYREDYEFIIWWCHRDYDALWQTFPASVKDLGQLWRDSGLLDEDGQERAALSSWRSVF